MNRNLLPIVALAAIIGTAGLAQQVNADFGTHTIWMNIKKHKDRYCQDGRMDIGQIPL
jgi:hypothetical protein